MEQGRELRVILVGPTGTGKSSAGNTLLGSNVFKVGTGMSSVTLQESFGETEIFGRVVKIIDTPDIANFNPSPDEEAGLTVARWKLLVAPRPNVVLLTVRCDMEYSESEFRFYRTIKRLWGDDFCQSVVVLFTFGDQQLDIADQLKKCSRHLRTVMREVDRRYHVMESGVHGMKGVLALFNKLCNVFVQQDINLHHLPDVNRGQELCFLIVGKTGSGKSTAGNVLLGSDHFAVGAGLTSNTLGSDIGIKEYQGKYFKVVDTPDVSNLKMDDEDVQAVVHGWKQMIPTGPHAILLAVNCSTRYMAEEHAFYCRIKRLWGEPSICSHLIILFTFGDLPECSVEEQLETVGPELKSVLKDARNRYVVFRKNFKPQTEIDKLLKMTVEGVGISLNPFSHLRKKFSSFLNN